MKFWVLAITLCLFVAVVSAENLDLSLEEKTDETLVSILNNASSSSIDVDGDLPARLRLYTMSDSVSVPIPCLKKLKPMDAPISTSRQLVSVS